MHRLSAIVLSGFFISVWFSAGAKANDRSDCVALNSPADLAVEACGRLISAAKAKPPELSLFYGRRSSGHYQKRQYDSATADASEAIRLDAKNAYAFYIRGTTYLQKGDIDRALADLSQAIQIDPTVADPFSNRSVVFNRKGEYDRSISDATEAIRLDPNNAVAFNNRAWARERLAQNDAAIADATEAIRLNPKLEEAFINRASAQRAAGKYDDAISDATAAIKLNPKHSRPFGIRGAVLYRKGEVDKAIADLNEAITLDPKNANFYIDRAFALNQRGQHDSAIADASEAIRLNPKFSNGFSARGNAYYMKGDYDRAAADLSEAIKLNSKEASYFGTRAVSLARAGYLDSALEDANEGIKLNPRDPAIYNNRAFILNGKGEFDRALVDLDEAIKLNPKVGIYYKNRGISYENKRELDKALADYRLALSLGFGGNKPSEREAVDGARRVEQKLAALNGPAPDKAAAAETGRRVALVIGNAKYANVGELANPANDASDMADVLRKTGFEVVEGVNLDKRSMEDKVREFGRKLDGAALALFFYAGHGMQVAGKNYLLPVDTKLERPGDLNFEAMDVGLIVAQMESDQRVNLIFLDACRNNPLARSLARSLGTRSATVGEGLAGIQGSVGTLIGYATQPDAVALDGDGRNSPFTGAMLRHLSTSGLEIGTLMRRVRVDVVKATHGKQVPWDHSSLMGDVVLVR
jgi:tetratricopeptide (TPR) repeat protein